MSETMLPISTDALYYHTCLFKLSKPVILKTAAALDKNTAKYVQMHWVHNGQCMPDNIALFYSKLQQQMPVKHGSGS